MLAEMLGKGGHVCAHAAEGTIRCPLLVRPTSEDVITGQIMQTLRTINPRWWLPELLNRGLGTNRFRRQVYRRLQINLWENRPGMPTDCVPSPEGSTQVDAVLRWENPATTIYLEFKYLSPLSATTSNGPNQDQLLRNIRVGLQECGYYRMEQLFKQPTRSFYQLVLGPRRGNELVERYQNREYLSQRLAESPRQPVLPTESFLGELGYQDLFQTLAAANRYLTPTEKLLARDLTEYLQFKGQQAGEIRLERQQRLLNLK